MRPLTLTIVFAAAAAAQNPFMQAYMPRYNTMKQNLIESARAMPEEHYSFKLTPEQRAFGDWIGHTIMLMHNSCAAIRGEKPAPMDHSKHGGSQPKAELVKALEEASANCDAALKDMPDATALTRANPMLVLLTNMASHYGNMVGYMRSKNIVPPSTARAQKK
jgi:hypothetical protein